MKYYVLLALTVLCLLGSCKAPGVDVNLPLEEAIRLNQHGFYPSQSKIAVILDHPEVERFMIWDVEKKDMVYEGVLSGSTQETRSGRQSRIADFSTFTQTGEFLVVLPTVGKSHPFRIQPKVNEDLAKAGLKAFYFQRASMELLQEHAGIWARPYGHPDTLVMIHENATSAGRPAGTVVSAPMGWYDAGDYNKYIVNSGITVGTLLSLYEDYPAYFQQFDLGIPESGDRIPDLLDEIRWNLNWMIAMQDPGDGGVYHKLTTARFEGNVQPHEAVSQRYMVSKSTAAALDFAAVMAQASRVFKDFSPEESVTYLKAAEKAWNWSVLNPDVLYKQDELNAKFDPDVVTGAYGDRNLSDEWVWAASELFVSTQNLTYWEALKAADLSYQLPTWSNVAWLGYYSLIRHQEELHHVPEDWIATLKINLISNARNYVKVSGSSAYHVPMGGDVKDFAWGSNSVASNQGILLLYAFSLTGEASFLQAAMDNLDYIMGRNATGYSFVTGFGTKSPMNPHHRLAGSRPDHPPLPGFLSGGPNPGQQDGCTYPSDVADESYVDDYCSYASNEIAINWNAPFAYLVNALEAVQK